MIMIKYDTGLQVFSEDVKKAPKLKHYSILIISPVSQEICTHLEP